jgi:hypothetical protein
MLKAIVDLAADLVLPKQFLCSIQEALLDLNQRLTFFFLLLCFHDLVHDRLVWFFYWVTETPSSADEEHILDGVTDNLFLLLFLFPFSFFSFFFSLILL